jgi:glycerol-3-phosphate dehydrogenase
MKVAIIGGGINGLCCAWLLAQQGHQITLYERNQLASATSRASSKLLHGGLRYLEQGQLRLVRESLQERDAWLQRVPSLTRPLQLVLPIYQRSSRSRWLVGLGLWLYDCLSGYHNRLLPKSVWLTAEEVLQRDPCLQPAGLQGAYAFYDGQMDDYQLALWVAEQARAVGATLLEHVAVQKVGIDGSVQWANEVADYDRVINVCGPWAETLLLKSGIASNYRLDTVRGSHLILNQACLQAYLLQVPHEQRIFFVLPWQGKTLLGTTEIRQQPDAPIECSIQERDYLLAAYNHYRTNTTLPSAIASSFAGIRPLLYSTANPSQASREYAIERQGKLINVFGGKWTTALALAGKVNQIL